jgi:hypothetical protein
MNRRQLLRAGGASLLALPFVRLLERRAGAHVTPTTARRLIIYYYPDGVPGPSSNGEPSAWHPTGSGTQFTLPDVLASLAPYREHCVFFRGLSMGGTDVGSHPGGAKKLLTATDGGNGDLARSPAPGAHGGRRRRSVLLAGVPGRDGEPQRRLRATSTSELRRSRASDGRRRRTTRPVAFARRVRFAPA